MKNLFLVVSLLLLTVSLGAQKELSGRVARRVDTVNQHLAAVEKDIASQNLKGAKSSLLSAQKEMKKIFSWYKGKFDESHPKFVATQTRLQKAEGALGATASKAPVMKPVSQPVAKGSKKLHYKVVQALAGVEKYLLATEAAVAGQNIKDAKSALAAAERAMEKLHSWHKDKFSVTDPQYLVTKKHLDKVVASVRGDGGLTAQAGALTAGLDGVIGSLSEGKARLKKAMFDLRQAMSAYGSASGDESIATAMAATRSCIDVAMETLTVSEATAAQFRKQFPDMATLKNLTKKGQKAESVIESIEEFRGRFERLREGEMMPRVRDCKKALVSSKKALARDGGNPDIADVAVDRAKGTAEMLQITADYIEALAGPKGLRSAKIGEYLQGSKEMREGALALRMQAAKVAAEDADAKKFAMGRLRFPKTAYEGAKWNAERKEMAVVFEASTKDKRAYRCTVHSPWEQRTEARWRNDRWLVGTYKYLGGTVMGKLADGRYRVYRISFRRTQQGDGSFGPLEAFGFGHSFEILAENKDK